MKRIANSRMLLASIFGVAARKARGNGGRTRLRGAVGVACVLSVVWVGEASWAQPVVLESAPLGTTGRIGGTSITSNQHVGWRFQTTQTLSVERVGGHLLSIPSIPGDIFAALISLPSIDSFPQGSPFTTEEVVATTTFRPNFPSDEILTPLSALLPPGDYALVFGTNDFGATGEGAIHNGPDQPDIPPTDISSYIFWGIPGPGQSPVWRTNLASNMRFIIEGQIVPDPIVGDLDGDGFVGLDDLDIILGDWNENVPPGDVRADVSGPLAVPDGFIGLDDLDVVLGNWLAGTPPESSVPEPTGTAILLISSLALLRERGRKKGHSTFSLKPE